MKTKTKKVIALISIVGILFTNTANLFAADIGTINIITDNGGLGTTSANINKEGNNASGSLTGLKVTATVSPILNLKLSNSLINLNDISTTQSGSITLEAGTNSPSGLIITATSSGGGLVGSSGGLINNTNGGNYNFSSSDGESTSNADFTEANPSRTFLTKTEITNNTAQEIYRTNKPEKTSDSIDDVKFTVEAKAQENAPAGNYEDFITFNITATF